MREKGHERCWGWAPPTVCTSGTPALAFLTAGATEWRGGIIYVDVGAWGGSTGLRARRLWLSLSVSQKLNPMPVFSFCKVNTWYCLPHRLFWKWTWKCFINSFTNRWYYDPIRVSSPVGFFCIPGSPSSPWLSSVQTCELTMCLIPHWIQGEAHTQVKKRWQRHKIRHWESQLASGEQKGQACWEMARIWLSFRCAQDPLALAVGPQNQKLSFPLIQTLIGPYSRIWI